MKRVLKAVFAVAVGAAMLGGCAIYAPPPGYYGQGGYYSGGPVYVGPPVSFGLGFGYWGGGGRRH